MSTWKVLVRLRQETKEYCLHDRQYTIWNMCWGLTTSEDGPSNYLSKYQLLIRFIWYLRNHEELAMMFKRRLD
ncbi:hypothetical protein KIN20_012837 [Parelaphostrongylus tenuis]|uniref:Uncharacterized protein n=1 Tax=Parelaphostrongylus tenuis TaxID=148309 RepID=A0AAD5MBB2_PARTN|nr:hypothetical protein KIN20_012837 [Parelaphostrongylus tenuis]